jgi:hypothetical protein
MLLRIVFVLHSQKGKKKPLCLKGRSSKLLIVSIFVSAIIRQINLPPQKFATLSQQLPSNLVFFGPRRHRTT